MSVPRLWLAPVLGKRDTPPPPPPLRTATSLATSLKWPCRLCRHGHFRSGETSRFPLTPLPPLIGHRLAHEPNQLDRPSRPQARPGVQRSDRSRGVRVFGPSGCPARGLSPWDRRRLAARTRSDDER